METQDTFQIERVQKSDAPIRRRGNKKQKIFNELDSLEPGDEALKIPFEDDKDVRYIRSLTYSYNNQEDGRENVVIHTSKSADENCVYLWAEEVAE